MPRTASKHMATIDAQELTHAMLHPAPAAPFSSIGGAQLQALPQLTTIFDASLAQVSTGTYVHIPSNGTNIAPSLGFHSPIHAAPVPTATPTAVHNTLFPTHSHPRMGPNQAPSPRVIPHLDPSPLVGPSRTPSPRVSPSPAPSPRVIPSPAPSPRVSPSQDPPAVPTTPHHFRHQQNYPRAHVTPTHRASPHTQGNTGTNLCADFGGVVEEEEVPPQHHTRSQTARHSAYAVHALSMANAVVHPTTGANMEYRGLV
jgi:hypothetical protein